ncbi:MAG TPA: hypothetical protein VFF70_08025 [Anaerolineae bacterium]|nr:hypothetical protein [Anaerolineae bacterium]
MIQKWTTGQIIRVDILTPIGREFADGHNFEGTPTFVLFNRSGQEINRWRRPPSINELP